MAQDKCICSGCGNEHESWEDESFENTKLNSNQRLAVTRRLKGQKVTGFNFSNSDVVGLELGGSYSVFVPNDDVLIAISEELLV